MDAQILAEFGKVASARELKSKERVYIQPGKYLLELRNITARSSQMKGNANVIAEFMVRESLDTDPAAPANKVGTTPAYVINISNAYGQGNLKSLIKALSNGKDEELTVETLSKICGAEQPLRGKLIRDTAFMKPTKQGTPFTRHDWVYVEQDKKDIQQRAAKIASGQG